MSGMGESGKDSATEMSFALHSAARLLRRNFDRRARDHGLSDARWQVLWHLTREQGLKQTALAGRLEMAPISLARLLDKLQGEGLVERRPDPQDRRCFKIYPTDQVQPAMALLGDLAEETRNHALDGFTAAEIGQLQALLGRLRKNLIGEEIECD
ncbi:MarR family winged helix-turn-helix transcriptional regulator [Microbulbifer variabilis]|uniref:MarR family winged helix-turn-helix transcriptional regulator n=1 Tax=Microbulbifer variabilis TaxID=266805 RepID=UPI001CFCE821|nr:MarR family transcriptional regulator [Microbulbifer variabilis]